ncbi:MAG: hypothetical protein F2923_09240 [Actinobacteria bacterium]|uniref:Unannotated protein n=1 Tax=freshwater metagenome TaxID=449393 RepID=A0A6J7H806_9ZZZZ|nr:hypothetical protein [Actinomycetota bacterium]MTB28807.1 hypothetical protein [Actinomycetota bacterium]
MALPELRMTSVVRAAFGLAGGFLILIALAVLMAGVRSQDPAQIPVGGNQTIAASPAPSATALIPTALDPTVSAIQQSDVRSQEFLAAKDLSNVKSTAIGYRVSAGGVKPIELAAVIAQQFGVTGKPIKGDNNSYVVSGQAQGPEVTVYSDPLVRWHYTDQRLIAGEPVNQDTAKKIATTLLAPLGVPVSSAEWQITTDQNRVVVRAWLVLKGLRTELGWTVVVAPDGEVVWADGFAAALVAVPGYPVLGAVDALDRALEPGWAFAGPTPWTGSGSTVLLAVPGPVPTVKGRPVLVAGVQQLLVNKAELGLAQFWQPDGSLLILPSYIVNTDDDRKWSLLAVGDAYVTTRDLVPAADAPNPANIAR